MRSCAISEKAKTMSAWNKARTYLKDQCSETKTRQKQCSILSLAKHPCG